MTHNVGLNEILNKLGNIWKNYEADAIKFDSKSKVLDMPKSKIWIIIANYSDIFGKSDIHKHGLEPKF